MFDILLLQAILGVCHGDDVPFVFDHGDWTGGTTGFTAAEEALATTIGAMWAAFAATGVPTHPDAVPTAWPRFTNATDLDLVLDVGVLRTEAHPRAQFCDFWSRWTSSG